MLFPDEIPEDEMDLRIKEWTLAGVDVTVQSREIDVRHDDWTYILRERDGTWVKVPYRDEEDHSIPLNRAREIANRL